MPWVIKRTYKTGQFCFSTVSFVDSAKVYGRTYGLMSLCDAYPHCDARVGCHSNSSTPLGTLANAELRRMRLRSRSVSQRREASQTRDSRTHASFDRLWKSCRMSRSVAYKWLAKELGISVNRTHVGMFDFEQCQRAIIAVERLFSKEDIYGQKIQM